MCTAHPKWGVFSYFPKSSFIVAFTSQLVKKLQQGSLYKVIEDTLLFVLNTKRPLSDIWLLSYKQNSFECFLTKLKFHLGNCLGRVIFRPGKWPSGKLEREHLILFCFTVVFTICSQWQNVGRINKTN